ncbi:MAG: DUF7714 family protein [Halobacteriota archaeon]
MIFPDHCMYVAVRDCDDLTARPSAGEPVYFSSRYLVLFWHGQAAIYEVNSNGEGLIRSISVVNKIAGFDETSVYEQKVDIFNRSRLITEAKRLCKPPIKAVLFQGFDLHWTFVFEPDVNSVIEIEVFDITPPDPPYLVTLIKKLEDAGIFGDLSVQFKPVVQDLRRRNTGTIFPCSASGIGSSHLNRPGVKIEEGSVLVGCDISRQVLEARFPGSNFEHENICPTKTIRPHKPFIAKCCRSARVGPIELFGIQGCIVHWGATPYEVVSAIRELVTRYTDGVKKKQLSPSA